MRNTIIIIILSLMIFSCSKDNVASSPVLKYKSVNTTVLQEGQYVQFTLTFTDTNGDADSLFVQKVVPACPASDFTDSLALPGFPSSKKLSGDILVTYGNGVLPLIGAPQCGVNDSCYFRFVLKDLSGQKSDTIQTPYIVVDK
jgi:hypothetical protein